MLSLKTGFQLRPLNRSSIFVKLVIVIFLISAIPAASLTIYSAKQSHDFTQAELAASYDQVFSQYIADLDDRIAYHTDVIYQLTQNYTIQEALTGHFSESTHNRGLSVSKEISRYMGLASAYGLENCIVYSYMEEFPIYHHKVTMLEQGTKENWFKYYENRTNNNFIYDTPGGIRYLSFVEDIVGTDFNSPFYGTSLGLVKVDVNIKTLFSSTQNVSYGSEMPYDIVILTDSGEILFCSDKECGAKISDLVVNKNILSEESPLSIKMDGKPFLLFHRELSEENFTVILRFSGMNISDKMHSIYFSMGVVIILSLLAALFCALLFTVGFSKRIRFVLDKMDRVESGDLKVWEKSLSGSDEIATIDGHFNDMLVKLIESMNKNYIADLAKKDAELRALQHQINPHFLYNTLETISSMAMEKQVPEISDLTEKLGELFRYATNKENIDYVSLNQELKNTENYIYIQQVRFPALFEVFYLIDEGCEELLVPRFILQPLVENAIKHGFKNRPSGNSLELSAHVEGNDLIVCVADDGNGMDKEQLNALIDYLDSDVAPSYESHKTSVGLKNVHLRLKYCYGESYGLSISGNPGKGTMVSVRIPQIVNSDNNSNKELY